VGETLGSKFLLHGGRYCVLFEPAQDSRWRRVCCSDALTSGRILLGSLDFGVGGCLGESLTTNLEGGVEFLPSGEGGG
jgi:hypothetical protein